MNQPTYLSGISLLIAFAGVSTARAGDEVSFNRDIRPLLSDRCFACHGPDENTREGELRLDQQESATQAAASGERAIVPGNVSASELIRRITADDEYERMPPVDGSKPLTDREVELLKAWIANGAEYQAHWSFVAPRRPDIPKVTAADWCRNEIDRFVLAKLEAEGKTPAREAGREALIRRVAFDLTGLPPGLEEIDEFLSDRSPDAYERMVDRYLASSAYGEHMARHWLDLARYADTNGYQYDTERTQWVWRDWVIDAYNRNKPFDEFTIEQLAGDLLPDATLQQRLATGFNRNHGITIEGGIIDEEYRTEYVMDRLVTTGEVWMGLTIGCARCHEHKFDPISQREFYQLYAFFNQVAERGMRGFDPQQRIPSPLAASQQEELAAEIARFQEQLKDPNSVEAPFNRWVKEVGNASNASWQILSPLTMKSSGGSELTKLPDDSVLAGSANPQKDIYEITARTDQVNLTAVRLEALTHESLPGGGPGRHSNSNFVLSEFELTVTSAKGDSKKQTVKFTRAMADYSQANYGVANAIDGSVAGNNGWAVDGPTRKKPATAVFVASAPFGFPDGTELHVRLRHEADFQTHGIGRPRLSITTASAATVNPGSIPARIRTLATKAADQRSEDETEELREYFMVHHSPHVRLKERIRQLETQMAARFPSTMIMQDLPQPRDTFVLERGEYSKPTEKVTAAVPAMFPAMPASEPKNRLGFATWLVDPAHPLTARVAVNRYWQRLFGVGLVKTSEDFGLQGEPPSHPDLLDWLATTFVHSGWDVKQMQKLIVTSATYRQTSHASPVAYLADPENRLLARGPRMRLDAEEIRDAALAFSGVLVRRVGGRSVYPYQPVGLWLELNNRPNYSKAYPRGQGDDLYRRSLYTFWKRTVPSPMLKTFDAPEREFCTIRRSRTNTPLQALLLLNGPQFVEAARLLTERMMTEGGESTEEQITYGFRLVTARPPRGAELSVLLRAYEEDLRHYSDNEAAALKLLQVGEKARVSTADISELAAMANIARLLLNLNEAITKG